jgi:hypothetical protein
MRKLRTRGFSTMATIVVAVFVVAAAPAQTQAKLAVQRRARPMSS